MEINKILQADYLDLIFDNRNKDYGSYELRKHYHSRALKAIGIMLAIATAAGGTPYIIGKLFPAKVMAAYVPPQVITPFICVLPNSHEKEKIKHPPVPKTVEHTKASIAKTFADPPPKIVKNVDVPKDIAPVKDPKDAVAGAVTNPGNNGINAATTKEVISGPPVAGTHDGDSKKETLSGGMPVMVPDIMPEYPGGMEALMKYLQQNMRYPAEAREAGIQGKVIVRFIVNEAGRVENAIVLKGIGAGCDKEALRVVNAMKGWKPGKVAGKAVKVYYTLPITFKIE
jgi:protein TonB